LHALAGNGDRILTDCRRTGNTAPEFFELRQPDEIFPADGQIALNGRIPCATMGGLKARGFPGGATGVYQAVEAAIQLRGQAEANQIADTKYALIQSLGGPASTAVTHVLERII